MNSIYVKVMKNDIYPTTSAAAKSRAAEFKYFTTRKQETNINSTD